MTVPSDAATRNSDNFGAAKGIAARWPGRRGKAAVESSQKFLSTLRNEVYGGNSGPLPSPLHL